MAAHYDDPSFSYTNYWLNRDYENQSEIEAIKSLLKNQKFSTWVDIGGGYGRLIPKFKTYSQKILLIEPSLKQRKIAQKELGYIKSLTIISGTAEKTKLQDKSVNLITMIRVMHHIPDPIPAFKELFRILKPGGVLILEFANSKHFKAQIQSFLTGKPILPVPIEKRSQSNIKKNTISFVNHHPHTIVKQLKRSGFVIIRTLSVSNLRSPFLKKLFPLEWLVTLEKKLQTILNNRHFGPSIFILAKKPKQGIDNI